MSNNSCKEERGNHTVTLLLINPQVHTSHQIMTAACTGNYKW